MARIKNMKRFLLLVLLTQCSIASELSSAQLKAEIVALELMAEIKAEMAFHNAELASLELMAEIKAEMGVTECVFPEARILNREYHSSLRVILLNYEDLLNK